LHRSTVRTVPAFLRALTKLDDFDPMMFRGQSQDWPLLPSIGRRHRNLKHYSNWRVFELDLVERFAKYGRPLISPVPEGPGSWLLHAQHYGVPTRLLDWTTNPLKALFWAVEDSTHYNADGVVWAFSPKYYNDDPIEDTVISERGLTPFFPKHMNARIVAQEACFVAFPLPTTKSKLRPMPSYSGKRGVVDVMEKILIPARAKDDLLRELNILGVTHRTLYPDLYGLAKHIEVELRDA
jgi:hypothetical protein